MNSNNDGHREDTSVPKVTFHVDGRTVWALDSCDAIFNTTKREAQAIVEMDLFEGK
ncbi:hypothetical protein [Buttiauxella sp. BIGb0552]|uniref:hypothetical protein n=1 Tax=Buttiauxella sp. BIGb0552 TaxID=2485120 RepID=UPI001416F612|nr:hypothetical protein [Buttiauxella sp. BIGb0552]